MLGIRMFLIAGVGLRLGLPHRRAEADDDQHDARRAGHEPLAVHLLDVLDVDFLGRALLEDDRRRSWRPTRRSRRRRTGKGGTTMRTPIWKPLLTLELRVVARGEVVEELADRRQHALLLDDDRRVAEARGELQRVDAVAVDDAVEVDVADVALLGEPGSIFGSVWLKSRLGPLQNIDVPISPVDGPMFPGKSFLCSKLTLIGVDELLAVEEGADRDLDAGDAALELEDLDLVGEAPSCRPRACGRRPRRLLPRRRRAAASRSAPRRLGLMT